MVGDYVWAWDEETGEKTLRRVTETYVNQTSELVHVFVGGEEIITTPTHPFYSPVKGWTDAAQLRAGDILVLVNGEYVVVEKVRLVTDVFPYSTKSIYEVSRKLLKLLLNMLSISQNYEIFLKNPSLKQIILHFVK